MISPEAVHAVRGWLGAVADDAPAGRCRISGWGADGAVSYGESVDLRGEDIADRLRSLYGLVASGSDEPVDRVSVQVDVEADRSCSAVVVWEDGCEIDGQHGFTRTLDPTARPSEPPSHWRPAAGQPWPQPPVVTADPDRLSAVVRSRLRPRPTSRPAVQQDMRDAETAIGVRFPPELITLYLVADGENTEPDEADPGLYEHYSWLSLAELTATYRDSAVHGPQWFGWPLSGSDAHLEPRPFGRIRRLAWHPGWIPFATDSGGNYLAVDTAPGPLGAIGQVIEYGRDLEVADYVAPSLIDLLTRGHVPRSPGADVLRLTADQLAERFGVEGPPAAALARLVAAEPQLQELRLFRLPDAHLAPLAGLGLLVDLFVSGEQIELAGLPARLESLAVQAPVIDLAPLRHHPSLRHVRLEGRLRNADVLGTFPALETLRVGSGQGGDLDLPRDLAGLRHLSAPITYWMACDPSALSGLAALSVAGCQDLAEWVAIAERFDRPGRRLADRSLRLSTTRE